MKLLDDLKKKAKASPKRIVFPEGDDLRVLRACRIILDEGIGFPVILNGVIAKKLLFENDIPSDGFEFVDDVNLDDYASLLYDIRKGKGLSLDDAKTLVLDVNYLGVLMVESGFVDCMISGANHSTAQTIKPALQIIKLSQGISLASSFFIMNRGDETYFFSDCAFNINPSAQGLCDIAISTARSAKDFGFTPKVALLSFSTKGSGRDVSVDRVKEALNLIVSAEPDLVVDGELQVDSALVEGVAKSKCPSSLIQGDANVLIFPDLNSGNIAYKLVERLGGFRAIGPIIQGLSKPVNDLSRGCSVEDIVDVAIISVVEAQK